MRKLIASIVGKTTFFVINQATIDSIPAEKLTALEAEQKAIDEENKMLAADLRSFNIGKLYIPFITIDQITCLRTSKVENHSNRG